VGVTPSTGLTVGLTAAEQEFVRQLVMELAADELGIAALPEAMRRPLLEIQCQARLKGLSENYPDAVQEILRVNGDAVGWIAIAVRTDEIRLVDIAISRRHRGLGIGTARVRNLLREADAAGKPVRLTVGIMNPAVRLYERLGFRRVGGDQVRYLMERTPEGI
jgi:ribosomal protein S18 acetylase RimI-like enzyme